MSKFEFRGHLNGVLRAGLSALRAKRAVVKVEHRPFLPVDLLHPASGGRAVAGAQPTADAPVDVEFHLPSEVVWRCMSFLRVQDGDRFLEDVHPDLRQHLPWRLHEIHPAARMMMIRKIWMKVSGMSHRYAKLII